MNTTINFFKELFTNRIYHFYWFTILWITTLFTWIPFLSTNYILEPVHQKLNFLNKWFINNESLLFSLLSILLLIETITLIFLLIAGKTSYYENEFQILYTFLLTFSCDSLLLFQLFKNIGIGNFGIKEILTFYLEENSFISMICFLSLIFSLLFIFLKIAGYFYRFKR